MREKVRKQPEGQRQLRVGEEIRHVLADALRRGGFVDPMLAQASLITVSQVKIAPDLKKATVYVMPLGGNNIPETLEALNAQAYYFQREIAHQMKIKFTPKLRFMADDTFGEAEKIERILKQINTDEA